MMQGTQGERGDSGDRGVGGERGPKGDHGQRGERGGRGLAGPRGRGAAVLFVITMLFVTGLTWRGERDSCERQAGVRSAARTFAQAAMIAREQAAALDLRHHDRAQYKIDHRAATAYERSLNEARPLDCSGLFPDTK